MSFDLNRILRWSLWELVFFNESPIEDTVNDQVQEQRNCLILTYFQFHSHEKQTRETFEHFTNPDPKSPLDCSHPFPKPFAGNSGHAFVNTHSSPLQQIISAHAQLGQHLTF